MIYDLLLKREIEDEYCLINNIMFIFNEYEKEKFLERSAGYGLGCDIECGICRM